MSLNVEQHAVVRGLIRWKTIKDLPLTYATIHPYDHYIGSRHSELFYSSNNLLCHYNEIEAVWDGSPFEISENSAPISMLIRSQLGFSKFPCKTKTDKLQSYDHMCAFHFTYAMVICLLANKHLTIAKRIHIFMRNEHSFSHTFSASVSPASSSLTHTQTQKRCRNHKHKPDFLFFETFFVKDKMHIKSFGSHT